MADGLWLGTVSKVVTGGYLLEVPRLARARRFGSPGRPITYPGTLTVGQSVLVGFLEGSPDDLVIIRPA